MALNIECCYAECRNAECRYAKCHYAEFSIESNISLNTLKIVKEMFRYILMVLCNNY